MVASTTLPDDFWADAHAHPQAKSLRTIRNFASNLPVVTMANGTCPADWPAVAQLAERGLEQGPCLPAFGVHPWFCDPLPDGWADELSQLLTRPGASLGEVGIDRWKSSPEFSIQVRRFREQLELVESTPTPITVHCLRAWADLRQHFGHWISQHPRPFLLHAFGGNQNDLDYWLERGALFSFSPSFFHPKRSPLLELFRNLPAESLLVETDCPSMAPPNEPPFQVVENTNGEPINHPANLLPTYERLARERQTTTESLRLTCQQNFRRFLNLSPLDELT